MVKRRCWLVASVALVAVSPMSVGARAAKGDPDKILQYMFSDQTLPDGKHPTWVYYITGKDVVRVDMPSLDMCIVTGTSTKDMDLLNKKLLEVVPRSEWKFALQIWKTAFDKYMITGTPHSCWVSRWLLD
jgi:hypothetical protein